MFPMVCTGNCVGHVRRLGYVVCQLCNGWIVKCWSLGVGLIFTMLSIQLWISHNKPERVVVRPATSVLLTCFEIAVAQAEYKLAIASGSLILRRYKIIQQTMHELKARGSDGLERATLYAESCRNSPSFVLQDTQTRSFGSGRQHQLLLLLLLLRRPPPLRVSLPGKHVPYSEYRCMYIYIYSYSSTP